MQTESPSLANDQLVEAQGIVPDNIRNRRELVFLVLSGLFLGTLGMLNILGISRFANVFVWGDFAITVAVGVLPYPLTFLGTVSVVLITHVLARALPIDDGQDLWPQLTRFIGYGYSFKLVAALLGIGPFYLCVIWLAHYLQMESPIMHTKQPHAGDSH